MDISISFPKNNQEYFRKIKLEDVFVKKIRPALDKIIIIL